MAKKSSAQTTILCRITEITTDPTEYKPYSPHLEPQDVFVEIPVEDARVENDCVILTLDGYTTLLQTVSDKLDELHDARNSAVLRKTQGRNR